MSDRYDAELKKTLQESTAKSLEGWEFTPSMRQAVLKRIAAEEAAVPTAAPAPPSHSAKQALTRPAIWMATAAAVLFVAFNAVKLMDGMGGAASRKDAPMTAQSGAPDRSGAKEEAKASAASAPGNKSAEPQTGPTSSQSASSQPKAETASAQAPTDAANLAQADAYKQAARPASPARIHLVAPESTAPRRTTLAVPEADPPMGIATALNGMIAMAASKAGETPVLTANALRMVDEAGAVIWEQPLADGPGLLTSLPGGAIAASAGDQVHLYTAAGKAEGSLKLPAPPSAMAFSHDGRLAVVAGDTLQVFQGAKLQFEASRFMDASLAFAPDGTLALVAREGSTRFLQLFGKDGSRLVRPTVTSEGMGLTFTADGQFVLAGGEVFYRSGRPAWKTPFLTRGAATLGPGGPVAVWGERSVSLRHPADGGEIWTAEFATGSIAKVAVSAAGDQVAILGGTAEGAVVWVLDQNGGQRFAERLPAMPVDLSIEGDRLLLLMPQELQTRPLSR